MHKKPVHWKADEIAAIADHLVGKGVGYWDSDFCASVRTAQQFVLAPDRNKVVKGRDNVPGMEEAMNAAEARAAAKTREREDALRRAQQAEEEERRAQEEAERLAAEESARAEAAQAVQRAHPLDKAMETLAQEMVSRFFYHLRLAFDNESRAMFESMGDAVPAFKHIAANRRRKIMIVGLKPREQGEIVREYGDRFEFKMVEFGATVNDVKQKIGHQENIIGMVDFIGHKHTDQVSKHPGYIPVSGHLDKLRITLNALAHKV